MGRPITDLTGKRFGKLTVLYRAADHVCQPFGQHIPVWHCRCDCGNECDARADSLKYKKTHCGCSNGHKKTQDEFIRELQAINPNITVLGTYVKYSAPIQVSCDVCGHVWMSTPNSLLQGQGCPVCGHKSSGLKRRKSDTEFKNQMKEIHPNVRVLETYTGSFTPIRVSCNICGNVWAPIPMSLMQGHGCPKCNVGNLPKRVICVETGIIYNSVTKASKITNISDSSIFGCCHGRLKTAGGYHWKFVDSDTGGDEAEALLYD